MAQHKPVLIFGAGASKACGGPLTDEILYDAFLDKEIRQGIKEAPQHDVNVVWECLVDHFHVPREGATARDFPSLTLLLSILDLSIERNRPLPQRHGFPKGL